jgi:hypothetical protein
LQVVVEDPTQMEQAVVLVVTEQASVALHYLLAHLLTQ